MMNTIDNQKGFSLIELMIAIAIFGLVVTGVVTALEDQMRSYNTQRRVTTMHQNARAAMYYMTQELKLAGLAPTNAPGAGIIAPARHSIQFAMDFTGGQNDGIDNDENDGIDEGSNGLDENANGLVDEPDEAEWFNGSIDDPNENIAYRLSSDADQDGICDGIAGGASCDLERRSQTGGAFQTLAVNVDALNFRYLGRNPGAAGCPAGAINCPLTEAQAAAAPENIRSVQVALVVRDGRSEPVFAYPHVDNQTYYNQNGDIILPPQNDGFRRYQLMTEIRCRNLGTE